LEIYYGRLQIIIDPIIIEEDVPLIEEVDKADRSGILRELHERNKA
jgi:hypothetical protein